MMCELRWLELNLVAMYLYNLVGVGEKNISTFSASHTLEHLHRIVIKAHSEEKGPQRIENLKYLIVFT